MGGGQKYPQKQVLYKGMEHIIGGTNGPHQALHRS